MPVLVAITIAALAGGGFLITSDPTIVAANPNVVASSTAQVKVAGGLESLRIKFNDWKTKHPGTANKASGTKATGTKATSTKVKVHHEAGVEGKIKAAENFIASVRHFLQVHQGEIKTGAAAQSELKIRAADNWQKGIP
ncbi:MAG: hypothetical protein HYS88_01185, partial [Candidatus Colwellbacteria bacterium]|nr:hypothetical protein [Candidatus Colwellbacteria bacterium]